jgi:hypothetical protein
VECYDPITDKWYIVAPIKVPRVGAAATVVNGKIYLAGGYTGSFKTKSAVAISSVLECFDPSQKK